VWRHGLLCAFSIFFSIFLVYFLLFSRNYQQIKSHLSLKTPLSKNTGALCVAQPWWRSRLLAAAHARAPFMYLLCLVFSVALFVLCFCFSCGTGVVLTV
jgi:hypothetical protein